MSRTRETETLLSGAKSTEVLGSLGDDIVEEVEVDTTCLLFNLANFDDFALVCYGELGTFPAEAGVSREEVMLFEDDQPQVEVDWCAC